MNKKSSFAFVAMLLLSACSVEPLTDTLPQAGDIATICATLEQQLPDAPQVRSALSDENAVVWDANDTIMVYSAAAPSAMPRKYSVVAGEGTSSATFSGEEIDAEEFLAVYPASMVSASTSPTLTGGTWEIPVNIPSVQVYNADNIPDEANLSVAVGGTSLAFKNVMGVIRIPIYGSDAYVVRRIQIAADEPLAGDAVVSYDPQGEPVLKFTGNTSKVLTIDIAKGIKLSPDSSAPTYIYAVVPAGAFASGLTVGVATSTIVTPPMRTTKDNTIHRSVIHNMPVNSSKVSFNTYIKDLANTYITAPGEKVRLYAYKPDGTLAGHVKSAGFSTIAYFSAVSDKSVSDGEISNYAPYAEYTASANEGSVVIAARDKDGIIWSWTVWITDTPEDVTLKDGTVIMDRNLGATAADIASVTASSTETRGLRFQWGRKDPCFNVTTSNVVTSAEVGTVEYTIANPTKFILPADGSANTGDWHWKGDNTLWGATKTIYDPCPAGYQIPCGGTGSTSIWAANDFAANKVTYDSTNLGYSFSVTDEGALWFPAATYYKYDSASSSVKSYSGGYYWCYNSVKMTSGSYNGRVFSFTSSAVNNSANQTRAAGCSIRCVKIK